MGDDKKPVIKPDGIHAGDWVIRPVPATGTDDHLDTPASRERVERGEDDAHAAQHSAGVPAQAAPVPVIPFGQGGDVDASIEAAREAAAGEGPEEIPIPIILRDPLTGKLIGSV